MKKLFAILLAISLLASCLYVKSLDRGTFLLLEKAKAGLFQDKDGELSVAYWAKDEKMLAWLSTGWKEEHMALWQVAIWDFNKMELSYYFYDKEEAQYGRIVYPCIGLMWNEEKGLIGFNTFSWAVPIPMSEKEVKEKTEKALEGVAENPQDFYAAMKEAANDLGLIKKAQEKEIKNSI